MSAHSGRRHDSVGDWGRSVRLSLFQVVGGDGCGGRMDGENEPMSHFRVIGYRCRRYVGSGFWLFWFIHPRYPPPEAQRDKQPRLCQSEHRTSFLTLTTLIRKYQHDYDAIVCPGPLLHSLVSKSQRTSSVWDALKCARLREGLGHGLCLLI